MDAHAYSRLKKRALQFVCYFQIALGVLITFITLNHPESEAFLIPSILVNIGIPIFILLLPNSLFYIATPALMIINFITTTTYLVTATIPDPNALAAMLLFTYIIHALFINIIYGNASATIYIGFAYLLIFLKQLDLFASFEILLVNSYNQLEFVIFLGLYGSAVIGLSFMGIKGGQTKS